MTQCTNPRCSREAPLVAHSAASIWEFAEGPDVGHEPMCVPCYLAYIEGHKRHPGESRFTVRHYELLTDRDKEELGI